MDPEIIIIAVVGASSGLLSAFVALVAQRTRTRIDVAAAVDARWKTICDEQQERLTQLQSQVTELEARVMTQRAQIDALWDRVHQGETAIIARDTRIALLEAAGMAKDNKIATLERQIAEMQQHIERIEAENRTLRNQ